MPAAVWPAQELLRHRDGVISTRVGYTGGKNDNPTADDHPGHAEAVEVIFDPERTSYRNILKFYFQIHRPDLGEGLVGADYRSEIFYASDEQRRVAEDTIADTDASGIWPGKVATKISEAGPFWAAKADDQDYLRQYPTATISSVRNRLPQESRLPRDELALAIITLSGCQAFRKVLRTATFPSRIR